jgi:type II secretory pathway pseudopilin PulG
MKKRGGFLLFEVLIAITIAGIVAMIYTTMNYYSNIQSNMLKTVSTKQILDVVRSRLIQNASDIDSDGYFEFLADSNNTLPVSINLLNDSWGRLIYYYPIDLGSANSDTNYTQNIVSISPNANILARVISSGENGVLDTTSSDANAINDDIMIEIGIGETNHMKLYGGSEISTETRGYNNAIVSATAPTSPIKGQLWYDTTNEVLYMYNGTTWRDVSHSL